MRNFEGSCSTTLLVIAILVAIIGVVVVSTTPGSISPMSPFTAEQRVAVQNAAAQMPALCQQGVDFVCEILRPIKVVEYKIQRTLAGWEYSLNAWSEALFGWMD